MNTNLAGNFFCFFLLLCSNSIILARQSEDNPSIYIQRTETDLALICRDDGQIEVDGFNVESPMPTSIRAGDIIKAIDDKPVNRRIDFMVLLQNLWVKLRGHLTTLDL